MNTPTHSDVIHLIAVPNADPGSVSLGRTIPALLCAHALKHKLTPPGRVILIGNSSCESQARLLGLDWHTRLAPPMGNPKYLARRIKKLAHSASRVICWNDELASLLKGIPAELDLISTSPADAPAYVSKRVNIRVFERSDRELWNERKNDASIDTVLSPILDNLADSSRPVPRASIGIDDNAMCIGVLADRPSDVDARELAFLLGLLNASGYTLTGIVPSTASHLPAARRHHRGLGSKFQLIVTSDPITTLLPIFDALIHPCFDGSGSSMLIERMCESADVPVLRLKHSGRAGLSRAPGVAGPIIERLDEMLAHKPEPTHV